MSCNLALAHCTPVAFAFQRKVQLLIDLDSSADFKYLDFKY